MIAAVQRMPAEVAFVVFTRIARNLPSAPIASSPWITLPRPWLSERKASERVDVHFTGRPVAFAAIMAAQYSGYPMLRQPKPPPTSCATTSILSSGTWV